MAAERTDQAAETTVAKCSAVRTVVKEIMRENAVVAVYQDCAGPSCPAGQTCMGGNVLRFETDYLMVRSYGRWKICKPISAGVISLGL